MNTRSAADPVTDIAPGIEPAEFRDRRARLMAALTENDIAIVPSASIRYRNRDTEYPFRQDSDFYYLTGFEEPDSVLVLAPGAEPGATVLFCPERDPAREQWTGERLGPERAAASAGPGRRIPPAPNWTTSCPEFSMAAGASIPCWASTRNSTSA